MKPVIARRQKDKQEEQENLPQARRQETLSDKVSDRLKAFEIALHPAPSEMEIYDVLYQEFLDEKDSERDKKLFSAMDDVRTALDVAAETQEGMYLDPRTPWGSKTGGTPWPQEATVIKVPRDHEAGINFDNEMTVYIDNKEVIRAHSSLIANDDSRENRVTSELGLKDLKRYKEEFLELLAKAKKGKETAVYKRLWEKPDPEYLI